MSTRVEGVRTPAAATLPRRAKDGRPPPRVVIGRVTPSLDCGRYPVKRSQGDRVVVAADVVRDGPDVIRAMLRYRSPGARRFLETAMEPAGPDRFEGSFDAAELGRYAFTIEAFTDRFATWRGELERKLEAGQEELQGELSEGAAIVREALDRIEGPGRTTVEGAAATLAGAAPREEQVAAALDEALAAILERHPDRREAATLDSPLEVDVDRELARAGAWYELFPRSFGGLRGVERVLPRLAELGFDVVYLTPVHPIGRTGRKGRNNTLPAKRGDPGSPWAIGAAEGGHEAIHPELGTPADFERLVVRARELGLDLALDLAYQCSVDHPWLAEHPEWFQRRPDGTIKYAENPPKRYQDIVSLDFDTPDWQGLWHALLDVCLLWVERGVTVFRVDNPHTKPFAFWEWLIRTVRARHPEVIFLSEAFTRPLPMQALAKLGFNQSYTYFTWRTTKAELTDYVTELAAPELQDFFRPNFFANTPDILHEVLQTGGRPAFEARLVLAATLSPSYGIYSGFEHCERVPLRTGSEEYLDSEKYQLRRRRLDGPLLPLVARLNAIRRENPALRRVDDVTFLETESPHLIAYLKREGRNALVVVVNLDPHAVREGLAIVPRELGLPGAFTAHDLLDGSRYAWHTGRNYVRLNPARSPAHVLAIEP